MIFHVKVYVSDLSSGVISRVVNREKYLEVIFFQLNRLWGGEAPPHPPFILTKLHILASVRSQIYIYIFFHKFGKF